MDLRGSVWKLLDGKQKTAADHAEQGDALIKKNDLEEAVARYDRALAMDPDNLRALRGKGYATRRMGDIETAKACYERIVAIAPDDMKAWLARGFVHAADGDNERALECYNRVLAKDPGNITATYLKLYISIQDLPDAEQEKAFVDFMQTHPGFTMGLTIGTFRELIFSHLLGLGGTEGVGVLGDPSYTTRDMQELEKNLPQIEAANRRMVQDIAGSDAVDISSPEAMQDPAAFMAKLRLSREAGPQELEDLRNRQPADPTGWFEKGDTLCRHADHGWDLEADVRQDLYREAGLCFDRVLTSRPGQDLTVRGLAGRGYAAMRLAQYDAALSSFEEAIRLAPEDAALWQGKAFSLSNMGRAEDAAKSYEKVQEIQDKADPHRMIRARSRERGYVFGNLLS